MNWYIIQVNSGTEDTVVKSIKELARARSLEDNIGEILVPSKDITQIRYGKKVSRRQKLLPGYVLVNMELTEGLLHLIKTIKGVHDFLGSTGKSGIPLPVSQAEIDDLRSSSMTENNKEAFEIDVEVGETVIINQGPFATFKGVVEEIELSKKKLKVSVPVFNRSTSMELDFDQVDKVD